MAVVMMVSAVAPHFVVDSFLMILFRADVLPLSLCMCSLEPSVSSKVTPSYRGICARYQDIFKLIPACFSIMMWKTHICVLSGFARK